MSIDPITGLSPDMIRMQNRRITMLKVTENGLTKQEMSCEKMRKTKTGSEISRQAGIKSAETRKKTIDPSTGLTVQEKSIQKRLKTMLEISENGLTRLENAIAKGRFRGFSINYYRDTKIYYQGLNEKNFLDFMFEKYGEHMIDIVKRAPNIWYKDPITNNDRVFMPDFLLNENIIVEIKSPWTWNNNIPNSEIEQRNIAKLLAAENLGYTTKLIINGIDYDWHHLLP